MTSIRVLFTALLMTITFAAATQAATEKPADERDRLFQERTYQGRPLTFWLRALRDRDENLMSEAFDAIYSLGGDAWIAVPELGRIVDAPFEPIEIGSDTMETIASKLLDISVRSEAIEALGWIGDDAAPSTMSLLKWALMQRISLNIKRSSDNDRLFIDLVAMDAEQRMRVAGAVARLGKDTLPAIAKMLASADPSKRKLATAILSQDALPVAAELLRSKPCEDRRLGLQILRDMDLIVEPVYIDELAFEIGETCSGLTKLH